MFGLPSFSKLLLLAAIIAAVWYGFRIIGQMQKDRDQARKEAENAKKVLEDLKTEPPPAAALAPTMWRRWSRIRKPALMSPRAV